MQPIRKVQRLEMNTRIIFAAAFFFFCSAFAQAAPDEARCLGPVCLGMSYEQVKALPFQIPGQDLFVQRYRNAKSAPFVGKLILYYKDGDPDTVTDQTLWLHFTGPASGNRLFSIYRQVFARPNATLFNDFQINRNKALYGEPLIRNDRAEIYGIRNDGQPLTWANAGIPDALLADPQNGVPAALQQSGSPGIYLVDPFTAAQLPSVGADTVVVARRNPGYAEYTLYDFDLWRKARRIDFDALAANVSKLPEQPPPPEICKRDGIDLSVSGVCPGMRRQDAERSLNLRYPDRDDYSAVFPVFFSGRSPAQFESMTSERSGQKWTSALAWRSLDRVSTSVLDKLVYLADQNSLALTVPRSTDDTNLAKPYDQTRIWFSSPASGQRVFGVFHNINWTSTHAPAPSGNAVMTELIQRFGKPTKVNNSRADIGRIDAEWLLRNGKPATCTLNLNTVKDLTVWERALHSCGGRVPFNSVRTRFFDHGFDIRVTVTLTANTKTNAAESIEFGIEDATLHDRLDVSDVEAINAPQAQPVPAGAVPKL